MLAIKRFAEAYRRALPEPLRASLYKGRVRAYSGLFPMLPRAVSAALLERLLPAPEGWLFIIGLNNSGTSLLYRILEAHPQIRSLPAEGHSLSESYPKPWSYGVGRLFTERLDLFRWIEESPAAPDPLRVRWDWARFVERGPGIPFEKSPPHTIQARWLQRHFSPARFIAITRSPYGVCEGIRRRAGFSVERAARHWALGNTLMLDDLRHIERYHQIRYEDLCADPLAALERLGAWLGLQTPLALPVDEPIADRNAASVARLSAEEIDTIGRSCGDVMARLGYAELDGRA